MLRGREEVGRDMLDGTASASASAMNEGRQTLPVLIVFTPDVFLYLSNTPFSAYRNPSTVDHLHIACVSSMMQAGTVPQALCSHRLILRNRVFNISSWFIKR